jgi:aminopeptidase N
MVQTSDSAHVGTEKQLVLKHVAIRGKISYSSLTFKAVAKLFLKVVGHPTILELKAMNFCITSIRLNGEEASYTYDGQNLRVFLEGVSNPDIEVEIEYSVFNPKRGLFIITPERYGAGVQLQAWTIGEDFGKNYTVSEDNAYWFPLIGGPSTKCTSEVVIGVPKEQMVVSNGDLLKVVEDGDTKWYHWKMDKPHSTYLIAFCAGEFDVKEESYRGVRLQYFVPKGMGVSIDRSFSCTPKLMEFYEKLTGARYPYTKFSQTCVYGANFGGMENTTANTLTVRTLHDEVAHIDFSSEENVGHHLAHQWFGDMVTCSSWTEVWLNEGLASYAYAAYIHETYGDEDYNYHMLNKLDEYLKEDNERGVPPVCPRFTSNPQGSFDRYSAEKGALVMHALKNLVGTEAFSKSIKEYFTRFWFGVADTESLRRLFEEFSKMDLEWFFDQWIYALGHPKLEATYSYDPQTKTLTLIVRQDGSNSRVYALNVNIEIVTLSSSRQRFSLELKEQKAKYSFHVDSNPIYVCFDPELSVIGELELHEDPQALIEKIRRDNHTVCRIRAARALAKEPSTQAVAILEHILQAGLFWGLTVEACRALGSIRTPEALRVLLNHTKHPDARVRREIARALGEYSSREVFNVLLEMYKSEPSYYVRSILLESMGKMNVDEATPILVEAIGIDSHNHVVAIGAIKGLSNLGNEAALSRLIEAAKSDPRPPVRKWAINALGTHTSHNAVRKTLLEMAGDESENDEVRVSALKAASKSHDQLFISMVQREFISTLYPLDERTTLV